MSAVDHTNIDLFNPNPEHQELTLRNYQEDAIDALRSGIGHGRKRQILCSPVGSGKCLAPGTKVLMWGGITLSVEDVRPGMALTGPDGSPRYVTSSSRGHGPMVEIVPIKGLPWRCNYDHILTLVHTGEGTSGSGKYDKHRDEVVDVSVAEWMKWSKTQKHLHKLFRAGVTEFPQAPGLDMPVDPYLLGVLLGDGSLTHSVYITSVDEEVVTYCREMAAQYQIGLVRVKDGGDKSPTYRFSGQRGGAMMSNPLQADLEAIGLHGHGSHTKFIPLAYLLAKRDDRLALLAGLIDTDGHLAGGYFDYLTASRDLADGVLFLARSLGLAAYAKPKYVRYRGEQRLYWRVTISGHVDQIPTRIPRKKAGPRKQKKDVLRTGFKIRDVGMGEYYGFTLTGDGRFLLGDFTVTHNTVIASAMMKAAAKKGSRVAFLVDRIALVDQTSQMLHAYGIPHGMIQADNRFGLQDNPIHILSMQSVEKNPRLDQLLAGYDFVIYDEAHTMREKITKALVDTDSCAIGLSATPFTKGLGDIYQGVVNVRTTDQLLKDGWLTPLRIFCAHPIDMTDAPTVGGEWSTDVASERVLPVVGDIVADWVEHTNKVFGGPVKTLVFSNTVADGAELCEQFNKAGVIAEQVSYRDKDDGERRAKIQAFREGRCTVLCSVAALEKGFDVPEVLCLVFARPFRRSLASVIQQLGRGMRIAEGKTQCLVLDAARNYLRFAPRIEEFFATGINTLAPAKLEKLREPAKDEEKNIEERLCQECAMVIPPGARECPGCGWKVPRRKSGTAVAPGVMEEYKRPFSDIADLWPHVCAIAAQRHPDDAERARKFAAVQFKELTGAWPSWGRPLEPAPWPDPRIADRVAKNVNNWRRRKRREEKTKQTVMRLRGEKEEVVA